MNGLVSVILPNYNHYSYLQERLDSILGQTYKNIEILILDDASSDDSITLLEPFRDHEKVSYFIKNEKNSGSPFCQWEKGIKLAAGDYIWIAETDDICAPDFLESQLEYLKSADVSVAKTFTFGEADVSREITHPAFKKGDELILNNDDQILYCPVLNVSAIVFKTSILKELADSQFSSFKIIGDRVFYYEFFQHRKIVYNPNTTSYFRKSGSGLSELHAKDLGYLKRYFQEHVRFIKLAAKKEKGALDNWVVPYIRRFFNRVRNRVPRHKKLSVRFFRLYFYYRMELLKNAVLR